MKWLWPKLKIKSKNKKQKQKNKIKQINKWKKRSRERKNQIKFYMESFLLKMRNANAMGIVYVGGMYVLEYFWEETKNVE